MVTQTNHTQNRKSTARIVLCTVILFLYSIIYAQPEKKVSIAVYGLKSIGIPQTLAESLQEQLESRLLTFNNVDVLSRTNFDVILKEGRFQQSGICTEEDCLLAVGHIAGVQKIITGTISKVGATYNIVLKLIDVETAKLESSVNHKHVGSIDALLDIIDVLLNLLLADRDAEKKLQEKRAQASQDSIAQLQATLASLQNKTTALSTQLKQEKTKREQLEERQQEQESERLRTIPIAFDEKYTSQNSQVEEQNTDTVLNDSTVMVSRDPKKARKIGIGAVVILAAVSAIVLLSQLSGNNN